MRLGRARIPRDPLSCRPWRAFPWRPCRFRTGRAGETLRFGALGPPIGYPRHPQPACAVAGHRGRPRSTGRFVNEYADLGFSRAGLPERSAGTGPRFRPCDETVQVTCEVSLLAPGHPGHPLRGHRGRDDRGPHPGRRGLRPDPRVPGGQPAEHPLPGDARRDSSALRGGRRAVRSPVVPVLPGGRARGQLRLSGDAAGGSGGRPVRVGAAGGRGHLPQVPAGEFGEGVFPQRHASCWTTRTTWRASSSSSFDPAAFLGYPHIDVLWRSPARTRRPRFTPGSGSDSAVPLRDRPLREAAGGGVHPGRRDRGHGRRHRHAESGLVPVPPARPGLRGPPEWTLGRSARAAAGPTKSWG